MDYRPNALPGLVNSMVTLLAMLAGGVGDPYRVV